MKKCLLQPLLLILVLLFSFETLLAQTPQYQFTNGTGGNAIPLGTGTTWDNYRSQFLYLPGDFSPTINSTALVTKIYFRISSGASATTYNDFKVSIGNTSQTALTTTYITGLTQALNASTKSFAGMSNGQWMEIELTTPVAVDFSLPIVVDVSQTGKVGGAGGYALLAGGVPVDPSYTGNTQTYGSNPSSTTGTARRYSYQFGVDVITCSTAINQQPVPKTICENEQTTFSITSTDATVFQWQVDEGTGFFDVTNGPTYSGATTQTLTVDNTPATYDNYQYRCLIAKGTSTSCVDTSDTVTLNVYGLVKADPLKNNDTTCIAASKDIQVKASGSITGYKWQIYNALTQDYEDLDMVPPYMLMGDMLRIIGASDTLDGARYRCVVSGICDTFTSNETRLTVLAIPKVGVHPEDITTEQGKNVVFEVQATAAGARYRWQAATGNDSFSFINDGGIYSGVKTNRLNVSGVSRIQDGYQFRCEVRTSSSCNAPGDTSNFGVLYVTPPASVNGLANTSELVIYPNPVGNELYIKTTYTQNHSGLKYKIVDKTGKALMAGNLDTGAETAIDVSRLAADIYLLEILDANGKGIATSRFTRL